jgi:hypothetical protein
MLRSLRSLRGSVRRGRYALTAHSTHIFAAMVLLRKPLYGLQKRHIQPERYVQLPASAYKKHLTFLETYHKLILIQYFDKEIDDETKP